MKSFGLIAGITAVWYDALNVKVIKRVVKCVLLVGIGKTSVIVRKPVRSFYTTEQTKCFSRQNFKMIEIYRRRIHCRVLLFQCVWRIGAFTLRTFARKVGIFGPHNKLGFLESWLEDCISMIVVSCEMFDNIDLANSGFPQEQSWPFIVNLF